MSMNPVGSNPLEPNQGQDNRRLLTMVVLFTAVWMIINPLLFPQQPAPPPAPPAPTTPAPSAPPPPTDPSVPSTSDQLPEQKVSFAADVAQASGGDRVAVKGGYRAEITTHGAAFTSFSLTGYEDNAKRDEKTGHMPVIDLADASFQGARPLALSSRGGDVDLPANAPYEITAQDARSATFTRLTGSGVRVTKTFTFDPARFAFEEKIVLKNEGATKRTAVFDHVVVGVERKGERDEGSMFAPPTDKLHGACRFADEREHLPSDGVEQAQTFAGKVGYVAIDRHFFLAALVPVDVPTEGCRVVPLEAGEARGLALAVQHAPIELAPGEARTLTYAGYFGPKQVGLLEEFGHGLDENIDFGVFGILSRPMLWAMVQFHKYTGNFGIAIILLTLVVKLLTFPLTQKSYRSMQEMKKIAPEIKELQKKYGNDRATLGQKQMALYQEKGINPMAGCFPVLVQLPIWFALYRTLASAVELYQQPAFLWITDLTQVDHSPLGGFPILPLIVGALMLGQTALQPPPEDQPQMKYVMWGMPIMFTFFMLGMASGLSIYMITNSILTMAQQLYVKRRYG